MEVEQPFDRQKNQRRAFIFITYESEEVVEAAIANPKQTVGGREVSDVYHTLYTKRDPSMPGTFLCPQSFVIFRIEPHDTSIST